MVTNIAPIIANPYLAKLGKIISNQTKDALKMTRPLNLVWKRFIDDGFGVLKGEKSETEYFNTKFNSLVKSTKIVRCDSDFTDFFL
jgi:hypothetical protein